MDRRRSTRFRAHILLAALALFASGCDDDTRYTKSGADVADSSQSDVERDSVAPDTDDRDTDERDIAVIEDVRTDAQREDATPDVVEIDTPRPDVLPPGCEATADTYFAAMARGNVCNDAADCVRAPSAICAFGQGCGGVLVGAGTSEAEALGAADDYRELGCPAIDDTCECPEPPAAFGCDGGRCVGCDYVCTIDCECRVDERGCDVPECVDATCDGIVAAIDRALPPLQSCFDTTDCRVYEFPICGSAGCFQRPIHADANTTQIDQLASQAASEGCADFTCGCDFGPDPVCLSGRCRSCPGDCDAPCNDLRNALVDEIGTQAQCDRDDECEAIDVPFCDIAQLGCYGTVINRYRDSRGLVGMIEAFSELGCSQVDCDCAPPTTPPRCVDNRCAY